MRNCKWIADSGNCAADELKSVVAQNIKNEDACFLAMMTDRFYAEKYTDYNLTEIDWKHLLELRVFNDTHELLAVRGSIGEKFSWRVTSDEALSETDKLVSSQFIDMNDEKSFMTEDHMILSTVGGKYSLPITKQQKRVKVMSYIEYDDNGMAKVADSRVCCFTE